jgi:hypothetical protein
MKECLGATAALMSDITFPKLLGKCANTMISLFVKKLLLNAGHAKFCPCCAQHHADFFIPDIQTLAFEMRSFESADFSKFKYILLAR